MSELGKKVSARSAGIVSMAVLCSRILGLLREVLLARFFGGGLEMDVFKTAFRLPNLLRDMFAEGALSTAFVTVFSRKTATEGDEAAWSLANRVASLAIVLSAVVLLGMLLTPWILQLSAPGFSTEKLQLAAFHARIMFPFILLVSLAALAMGLLNARDVYGAPAMASSYFNLFSIAGGVGISWWVDPSFGAKALVGLSVGTLLGGLAQLLAQCPALWRVGFRFRWDPVWRDPGVAEVLRLMGPAVVASSAVLVNVVINQAFASMQAGHGPVSWLDNAFRLMQLPLGMFGVAIGTVTLPVVSRNAALGDIAAVRSALGRGLRLGLLLTIPSTLGLVFLARPIISLIYEGGKYDAFSTNQTAAALQFYAVGLAAYAGIKVLAPAFYAVGRRSTPMVVSFLAIAVNVLLNGLFTFQLSMGYRGLALSTGCVALINFCILYELMRSHLGGLETSRLFLTLARLAGAGALLSGVCWWGARLLDARWQGAGVVTRFVGLGCVISVAAGVFFTAAWLVRVEEMSELASYARGRFGRLLRR
jgi:putative peptidoglycan lipid II flippase